MEFEDLKEIGGRPDIIYTCDVCEEYEINYDENSEPHWTRIFRVGDKDVCEWCIRKKNGGLV
jgi:hypothetical protein